MFDCGSHEIMKLHGAFTSYVHYVTKQGSKTLTDLCNLNETERIEAAAAIGQTIASVLRSFRIKTLKDKQSASRNVHAILFYKVLQSCGISCPAADEYYMAVDGLLVEFDWKFYLELLKCSSLSTYFMESMMQLPDDMMILLMQWTMNEIKLQSSSGSYLLNPILHILKHKLFQLPFVMHSQPNCSFQFNFAITEKDEINPPDEEYDDIPEEESKVSFKMLSAQLLCHLQEMKNDVVLSEILLDWMVSLVDIFEASEVKNSFGLSSTIEPYYQFIEEHFMLEVVKDKLIDALATFSFEKFKRLVATNDHFNAHPGYSLYLLSSKWRIFLRKLHDSAMSMDQCASLRRLDGIITSLNSLHPLGIRDKPEVKEEYLKMLLYILDANLDGVDYTCEFLLWDIEFRRNTMVVEGITRNLNFYIQSQSHMKLLMDSAVDQCVTKQGQKELVTVFFMAYAKISPFHQIKLLRAYVDEFGCSSMLMQPNYEDDILSFFAIVGKSPQDIDSLFFPLCIQSPSETVKKVFERMVTYGSVYFPCLELLKNVFFIPSPQALPLFHVLLQSCYDTVEESKKWENLLELTKEALVVFKGVNMISTSSFLFNFLLTRLSFQSSQRRLKYFLQAFDIFLSQAMTLEKIHWLSYNRIVPLITWICHLINCCVLHSCGHLKEMVVHCLHTLCQMYGKYIKPDLVVMERGMSGENSTFAESQHYWLNWQLTRLHPIVMFYLGDTFPGLNIDLSVLNLPSLLCWWVSDDRSSPKVVIDSISGYKSGGQNTLILALAEVVPHFTSQEFCRLAVLFEDSKLQNVPSQYLKVLADDNHPSFLEKKLKVISLTVTLVDVFVLLKNSVARNFDWNYMISSFLKAIKECLVPEALCPPTYSKVFLEICRMMHSFENHVDQIGVIQQDIIMMLKKFNVESSAHSMGKKYVQLAVDQLPFGEAQSHLSSLLA